MSTVCITRPEPICKHAKVCVAVLNVIEGEAKTVAANYIVIESRHGTFRIELNAEAKFVNGNPPKSRGTALRAKDHVLIDVQESDGQLIGIEVHYWRPKRRKRRIISKKRR
jgi:uncharacterized protein YuzE